MSTFAELNLSNDALKAVERLEYTCPTPVQEQAIPIVLEGRDLIAAASTGTGKTAAFLLPVLSTLPRAGRGKRAPRVLVVTPTRELAQQISTTCIKIARATGHFVSTVYGGTPYSNQIRELRGGVDVLIATPGRLKDLMARGVVDLSCISTLVLDEADRMLDMGFLPDVTTIVDETPEDRQTLLFSATIDQSIKNNLGSLLRDPAIVQIAHKGETAKTVEQFVMPIAQRDKADLLQAVLKEKGSTRVIVFARTKNRTEDCAEMLCDAGFSAESIHSDKSQGQRRRALENFRRGRTDILVATDVLARGIDVTGVDHVINYDLPDMPEDYVHRIGRTGRAGEAGYAISFVSPDTRRLLRDVEHLINREIPFMELESYELDPSILKQGGKGQGAGKSKRSGGYTGKRSGGYTGKARAALRASRPAAIAAARARAATAAPRTHPARAASAKAAMPARPTAMLGSARAAMPARTPARRQEAATEALPSKAGPHALPRARAKRAPAIATRAPKARSTPASASTIRSMPASARTPQATTAVPRAESHMAKTAASAPTTARTATKAARTRLASIRRTARPASPTCAPSASTRSASAASAPPWRWSKPHGTGQPREGVVRSRLLSGRPAPGFRAKA